MYYRVSLPGDAEIYRYSELDKAMSKATGLIKIHDKIILQKLAGDLPLLGKIFLLDPGHGGRDSGAHDPEEQIYGDFVNTYEKYINLDISLSLSWALKELGATVYMSRSKDVFVDLADRAAMANKLKVDYLISIHFNASNMPSANGVEVFTHTNKTNADTLAKSVVNSICKYSGAKNRGAKKANFKVLRDANMPGILIEYGFLTNIKEEKLCADNNYRDKLVKGTVQGILANMK